MKRLFTTSILVSLFLLVLTACDSPTNSTEIPPTAPEDTPITTPAIHTDSDQDGIYDSIETELSHRFSPIVRLHPDENYRPTNILWYLPRVRMRFNVDWGFDDQILDQGEVNPTTLITQTNREQSSGLTIDPTDFFLEQTDENGDDSLDTYRSETRYGSDPASWVCYTHVRLGQVEHDRDMYDIQYIFFYAYNGDMAWGTIESAHEADFEHITVRVEDDLRTIYQIYYAAHDTEGRWYAKETSPEARDGFGVNAEGRPIVYSALDSHASYPWPGQWDRSNVPDDFTENNGLEWDCKTNIINLGEKHYPINDCSWLQYSGRWGEIGELSWTTGPYGPAYQTWWYTETAEM